MSSFRSKCPKSCRNQSKSIKFVTSCAEINKICDVMCRVTKVKDEQFQIKSARKAIKINKICDLMCWTWDEKLNGQYLINYSSESLYNGHRA